MIKWLLVLFFCLAQGCAAGQTLQTPSGRPEVTITDASVPQVKETLINWLTSNGYQLEKESDSLLIFGKLNKSLAASFFFGSKRSTYPEERLTFTILPALAGGVRVTSSAQLVGNPGTGLEQYTDLNSGQSAENGQRMLEKLKLAFSH